MGQSSTSKEVCILSQFWLPDITGDSLRLRQLLAALRELGWRVTLVTTKPHYPYGDDKGFTFRLSQVRWEDGVRVVRIAMPRLRYEGSLNRIVMYGWFSLFASLYALFLSRGPVLWAFSMKVFSTYAALLAKTVRDPKLVSEVTDVWPDALVNTGYVVDGSTAFSAIRRAATVAYGASDIISTITPAMAGRIESEFSVSRGRVMVNPYVGREPPPASPSNASSGFTIVYYGNLGTNYDIPTILAVAERLRDEGVRVIIRGDGERLEETRTKIREETLTNVELISRVLSDAEIAELEGSADALILPMVPAKYEDASFPGKFVDYLFAGRPIIYVGGGLPATLITERELGLALPEPDIGRIADFIAELRSDPSRKKIQGENARRLAREEFSPAVLKQTVAALLERLVPS